MRIYIASDHAGFRLKEHLINYLEENQIPVVDAGPQELNPGDDYPDWIGKAAQEVSRDPENSWAIVIGMSGQGEAMVANKFKNVRAGVYYGGPTEIVKLLREHNDCNVLSLGAKFLTNEQAEVAVSIWIKTIFSNEARHLRRIQKIIKIENEK